MREADGKARAALRARLESRRAELEADVLTRVRGIADPSEVADPIYAESLRRSVAAALQFGLDSIGGAEGHEPPIPVELLAQARLAARVGVGLDAVLRRYFAGYTLLGRYMIEESDREPLLGGAEMQHLLRDQATTFDRLTAAVAEEHGREAAERCTSAEQRRAERVERLLAGEDVETSELAYDLSAHHLGILAAGPGAVDAIRAVAADLDRRPLVVCRPEGPVWAWLGGRRALAPEELEPRLPPEVLVVVGEPGEGPAGWRLSHRQATAALPIARLGRERFVRYRDVALLASVLQDDLLCTSLQQMYLAPLADRGDGGVLLETLRAYFAAGRNVSSAASALGVNRNTVAGRIRMTEERLGRPVGAAAAELETALRLDCREQDGSPIYPGALP